MPFQSNRNCQKTHVENSRRIDVIASSKRDARGIPCYSQGQVRRCKKSSCCHGKGKIGAISSLDRTPHVSPRVSSFHRARHPLYINAGARVGGQGRGGKGKRASRPSKNLISPSLHRVNTENTCCRLMNFHS